MPFIRVLHAIDRRRVIFPDHDSGDLVRSRLASQSPLGVFETDAQWVIFFLGSSLAITTCVQYLCRGHDGVHRWDHHNMINAGSMPEQ